ncbi:MAG: hypothetical protein QOE28_1328 [Solirubrobacteraceae bacterium]|jgi:hypothetical protein|nr:hypothetical protein [Solirubrobacteraceae bacterium]
MRSEGATALAVAAFGVSFLGAMQFAGGSAPKPTAMSPAAPTPAAAEQAQTGLELGSAPALPKLVIAQRAVAKPRAKRPSHKRRAAPKVATVRAVAHSTPAAPTPRPAPAATAAPVVTAAPAPVRTAVPRPATPKPSPTPVPTFDDHGGAGSGTFDDGGGGAKP